MADSVSTMLGDVDANMDYRRQLVEALRSKLGDEELSDDDDDVEMTDVKVEGPDFEPKELALVPPPTEVPHEKEQVPDASIEYLTDFLYEHSQEGLQDVFQQMDRGLDERQRLIQSLKNQLSKSAAIPKVASARPPVALVSAIPSRESVIDLEEHHAETVSMPPAKVARTASSGSALSPVASMHSVPQAIAPLTPLAPSTPVAPVAPVMAPTPAATAVAAELAARKAAMLRSLQEAETMGQLKTVNVSPPPSPSVSSGAVPFPQSGAATTTTASAIPADFASTAPECPPGSTPEQFEAFRRKCWEDHYRNQAEFCTVWKKYYSQNQAEQLGKGKTKSKLPDMIALAGKGKGGCGHPRTILPPVSVNPAAGLVSGGKGNPANLHTFQALAQASRQVGGALPNRGIVPRPVSPLEDIHSKLLGL